MFTGLNNVGKSTYSSSQYKNMGQDGHKARAQVTPKPKQTTALTENNYLALVHLSAQVAQVAVSTHVLPDS